MILERGSGDFTSSLQETSSDVFLEMLSTTKLTFSFMLEMKLLNWKDIFW